MKRYNYIYKYIFGGITVIGLAGCNDEYLYDNSTRSDSENILTFEAAVGRNGNNTRSNTPDQELEPLILTGGNNKLYLHRYVCDNSFDPAEKELTTRGEQANDMEDFIRIHQNFTFEAFYKTEWRKYVGPVSTQKMTLSEDKTQAEWKPDGATVYWPGDDAVLSFHAWAPATLPSSLTNLSMGDGIVSFSYEAQKSPDGLTDAESQTDLLCAISDCSKSSSNAGKAMLEFTHPLAAVKFAVRDVVGGTIKKISLKNVLSKGECLYSVSQDGGFDNGTYTWTNQSTRSDFHQEYNLHVEDYLDRNETEPEVPLYEKDKRPAAIFMMIPQTLSSDSEIEIVMEQDAKNGVEAKTIVLTGKIYAPEVPVWEAGKEYVYTISTSSSNWTNVFKVRGSYRNQTEIYMPSPADMEAFNNIPANKNYQPYYEVKSYRYRSNNPNIKEMLPWSASHGDGVQYYYNHIYESFAEKDAILYLNRDRHVSTRPAVSASTWIKDLSSTKHSGSGSATFERHNLEFLDCHVTTDWAGDDKMYLNSPYSGNSESKPWDLSTFGDQVSRNTANCYVVDREGWYSIPLYYGNAIKNGAVNTVAWTSNMNDKSKTDGGKTYYYNVLKNFKDHKGKAIPSDGAIPKSYYQSARLLWQDVYGAIDKVKLVGNKIVFHVNKTNIQQGNAVIGLSEHTDASWNAADPKIVWSWHIWINEHWLNTNGISNAFATEGFDTSINSTSKMQQQGDNKVTVPKTDSQNKTFYVTPYNIGWCDAKNVRYLSRYNEMKFVQYYADGSKKTGENRSLPIIQDGRTIEYKIGNNTYYQYGRKDPFKGFLNESSVLKEDFGDLVNAIAPQLKTLAYSIQHPNQLLVGATTHANNYYYHEWCDDGWGNTKLTEYYNLWNNSAYDKTNSETDPFTRDEFFTYSKTVYDPSPAGYTIPPAGFFKILFKETPKNSKGNVDHNLSGLTKNKVDNILNGENLGGGTYRIYTSRSSQEKFFTLTPTGNRWWAQKTGNLPGPGENFNGHLTYLWTNALTKVVVDRSAIGIAVGYDAKATNPAYIVSSNFPGRKCMGRPIRCIRE